MELHRRQFVIGPEPIQADDSWVYEALGNGRWLSRSPHLPVQQTERGLLLGLAQGETGRWVLLRGRMLELDASGLLGVFHRGEWLSSSPELLRTLPPELPTPRKPLAHSSDWFPPPRSGISGISRLLPSQTIDIVTGEVSYQPLLAEDAPKSVEDLAQMLVAASRAMGDVGIPLTGGRDSRLVLAAALAAGVDVLTYTRIREGMAYGDYVVPPKLAQIAGVPHYSIRGGRVREDLVALFDRHCALHSAERIRQGIAAGLMPDFGRPISSALVFELGRCYYWTLPEDLGEGLKQKPVKEWAGWVRQHPEPMDWRDRFYWEQRLGGWASATSQAVDLVTFERFFPANNRRFMSGLLNFPEEERLRGAPQQAMLEHLAPELATVPINPQRGTRLTRQVKRRARVLLKR